MANTSTPFDRNQRARQEQASAQQRAQRQQFAQAFAAGDAVAVDRFGKRLAPKQLAVYYPPPQVPLIFEVVDVAPNLDPNVPPGLVTVTLACTVPLAVSANVPITSMLVIGVQTAPGHVELQTPVAMVGPVDPALAPAATEAADHVTLDETGTVDLADPASAATVLAPDPGDSDR